MSITDNIPIDIKEELNMLRRENKKLMRANEQYKLLSERAKNVTATITNIDAMMYDDLKKQEKFMFLLLENSRSMILLFDQDDRLAYCSDFFLKFVNIPNLGYVSGLHYSEILIKFGLKLYKTFKEAIIMSRDTKQTIKLDEQLEKDSNIYFVNISVIPMFEDNSVYAGSMLYFNDLTDIITARDMAEQASRAKSDFLANMSHEMRTPMNAITGMTSIAKATDDVSKKDYCLDKIQDASQHLLGVINDILDMSKIEANKFELSLSSFSFESMISKVVSVLAFRVEERQQTFDIHIDNNIPKFIHSDEQRLMQVITNLVSNAVKFTPEHGRIILKASLISKSNNNCNIRIDITDTGIGISDEQKSRLFRSFEQADSSISRKFGGTGLGLAISKRIIELLEGDIWVESTLGVGSTFAFTFKTKLPDNLPDYDSSENIDFSLLRVIAVDDESDVLEFFKMVSNQLGFICDTASSGESAYEMMKDNSYNVAFIDWRMSGIDGIELTRLIKRGGQSNSVIVIISATEWTLIEDDAKSAGVDSFIQKPLYSHVISDYLVQYAKHLNNSIITNQYDDRFSNNRILLVEDVDVNREIIITLLEHTGLIIDEAINGAVAIDTFLQDPAKYDAIFMDIHMPEMDGYEATRRIRAMEMPHAKDIPIIAMTANVFREDVEKCLRVGMNSHIGKPINIDEVLDKLVEYLPEK